MQMGESLESAIDDSHSPASSAGETGQEAIWVAASRSGDSLAFNRLVLRWEKRIYNLTLRMLGDKDEAEEATQEVFLSAFRGIRRFRHDAKFSTWLYRIAVNQCITRLRRKPPGIHCSLDDQDSDARPLVELPAHESHEAEFLLEESRRKVRNALEHLPPEQRTVVELKFFQELTFEEISGIVDMPASTVKSRLYAGLEVLKVRLGNLLQSS